MTLFENPSIEYNAMQPTDSIRYSERKRGFVSSEEGPSNSQAKGPEGGSCSSKGERIRKTVREAKRTHRSERAYSAYSGCVTKLNSLNNSAGVNTSYYKYTYKKN